MKSFDSSEGSPTKKVVVMTDLNEEADGSAGVDEAAGSWSRASGVVEVAKGVVEVKEPGLEVVFAHTSNTMPATTINKTIVRTVICIGSHSSRRYGPGASSEYSLRQI